MSVGVGPGTPTCAASKSFSRAVVRPSVELSEPGQRSIELRCALTIVLLVLLPIVIGLIAWLEYLRTARYIVRETKSADGLAALGEAARGYRSARRRRPREQNQLE